MAKKKLIKLFENYPQYSVLEYAGGYCLYDKTQKGIQTNSMYIGYFVLTSDNKKYMFNGKVYSDIPSLVSGFNAYNETLPFNHEFYNPIYRVNYFIELCIHEYLTKIGMQCVRENLSDTYVKKDMYGQDICKIMVDVEEDTTRGKITRNIINAQTWTEIEFNDLTSAIAACNTLISTSCISVCSSIMDMLSNMTTDRTNEAINKVSLDLNSLNVYVEDERKKIIEVLEKELKKLKGEKYESK